VHGIIVGGLVVGTARQRNRVFDELALQDDGISAFIEAGQVFILQKFMTEIFNGGIDCGNSANAFEQISGPGSRCGVGIR